MLRVQRLMTSAAVAGLLSCSGHAFAQGYRMTVDANTSSLSGTVAVSVRFTGNMVGTYNATTNPTGTRTNPGSSIVAAPTNNPVPVSGTGGTGNPAPTVSTKPAGTYYLNVNAPGQRITVAGLSANLIGASPQPALPVSVSITYATFRTFVPNYLYTWFGFPIPISLGNATVQAMALSQDSVVTGALTPSGPNSYTYSLQVPCTLSTTILVQGSAVPNVSQSTLTFNGTVTLNGLNPPTVTGTLSIPTNITQTIAPTPGTPAPFSLPPPPFSTGPNADVLLTADIIAPSSATVNGTTSLPASGARLNPADIAQSNGDGGPNGVNDEGDYNLFFNSFFLPSNEPLRLFADVAQSTGDAGPNAVIDEGDYNCFFNNFFLP
jgi:hypothetical protein